MANNPATNPKDKKHFSNPTSTVILDDGPLIRRIKVLQASTTATERERRHWENAFMVARELDAKQDAIEAYVVALPPSDSFQRVQMGPITVREAHVTPAPSSGWASVTYGWEDAFSLYQEAQGHSVGTLWVRLNQVVDTILRFDEYRNIHGYCEGALLARRDIPTLAEASAAIASSLANAAHIKPAYSAAASALIAREPLYASFGSDRASLTQLKIALDKDYAHRSPIANDTITIDTNGDLVLPLDPGPFSEVTAQLEAYVTTTWSKPDRRLRIQWTTSADQNKSLWKIVSNDKLGRRAYVDKETRTIGLFSDVSATGIAHEFGHVLGLPDYYFTSYDAQNCWYIEESNTSEIMSDDSTGVVPPEYWRVLEDLYPFRR